MKLTINADDLYDRLRLAASVATSKGPIAITRNVLIEAKPGLLRLFATDLETSLTTEVITETTETTSSVCVEAAKLAQVVKGLKGQSITLSTKGTNLQIKCGKIQCSLVGVPPVEFPRSPDVSGCQVVGNVSSDILRTMLAGTLHAVSRDQGRPNLMGASFVACGVSLTATATDGHQLASMTCETGPWDSQIPDGITIPSNGIAALINLLSDDDDFAYLSLTGNNIVANVDGTTLTVRLIDAAFPDYARVVPDRRPGCQATLDVVEFLEKVHFAAQFANARVNQVTVKLTEDLATISASDPDKGNCDVTMPAKYQGPDVEAAFCARYLANALNAHTSESFIFQIEDSFKAALLIDPTREDDLFLVMPMRQ